MVAKRYHNDLDHEFFAEEVLNACYKEMEKEYRSEYIIKNTIANKILLGRHSLNTATLLSEFRAGKNIADCVIINGESTCYEIKTRYDKLDRLASQLESYGKLFNKTYVVTEYCHLKKTESETPDHVGIIILSERKTLREVRKAYDSNGPIDKELLLKSLRKREYIEIAEKLSGKKLTAPNTEIFSLCKEIFLQADEKRVRDEFHKVIKSSRKVTPLVNKLPKPLIAASIVYKLSHKQLEQLLSASHTKLDKEVICTTPSSEESSLNS